MAGSKVSVEAIDALLPQTQCEQCSYKGCKPYATAIAEGADTIDRCAPGGLHTMEAIANLLNIDPAPFVASAKENYQPPRIAVIREQECIGCTKCITACPVDAIIGSGKLMHTVLTDVCNGCNLCVEPCPMDCIDMEPIEQTLQQQATLATLSRARYQLKLSRQKKQQSQQKIQPSSMDAKKAFIAEALKRAQEKNQPGSPS